MWRESGLFKLILTAPCDKVGAGLRLACAANLRIGIFKKSRTLDSKTTTIDAAAASGSMGRILILSNKGDLSAQLRSDIAIMGHSVAIAEFDNAAEAIHTRKPDLVLVDLTLHGGIVGIWQQLRYDIEDTHTFTIVVIPKDRTGEIELLAGMNDFILYPYDVRELKMRVKLILKQRDIAHAVDAIRIGNLVIDPAKYEVTVDGWPVVLTLKEYELLKYLATHRGRVITREILLDQVWGYNYYGGTRTVDVHIGRLRTKIETGRYSFIRTVRGVGYIFAEECPTD